MGDFFRSNPGIDICRGHRVTAGIRQDFVTFLLIEVRPEINVRPPETMLPVALDREIKFVDRFLSGR